MAKIDTIISQRIKGIKRKKKLAHLMLEASKKASNKKMAVSR